HTFTVPLDHHRPDGAQIEVFAREVGPAGRRGGGAGLPWLVYLTGGPGFGSPRPFGRESWLNRALDDYRVLLLDQRGTGRSTPASRHSLARLGSARAQADYLACFRADSIVRDAELIRRRLLGDEPWTVLGQSFGGFCTVTYLSVAPEGIREALIAGGLPGLGATAEDVYRVTYPIVAERNRRHYERFPLDADRARAVARHLAGHEVIMPGGGQLTVPAFQSLGRMLGTAGGSDRLHYLLEDAFAGTVPPGAVLSGSVLSDAFLARAAAGLSFAEAPLYALVHEACYAQEAATRWAADRIMAEFPEFDPAAAVDGDITFLFTGEMIYPWMFETDPVLRPLQGAAEELAQRESWPRLYDPARLAANDVPAAAAAYYEDMYVPLSLSMPTARVIRGLRPWVTNEYQHEGLAVSNGGVLDRLIALARGTA
ncbi:MAG: alpha/beta fold hydrolase, partial [Streptosporangiaceae bacterium]